MRQIIGGLTRPRPKIVNLGTTFSFGAGFPNAGLVFSLRKVIPSYSVNKCIDVVRASDSAVATIGFTGVDLDTVTLATFLAATTGTVSRWYNQSIIGLDAIQATAAFRPAITIIDATFGGKPSITFGDASSKVFMVAGNTVIDGTFVIQGYINMVVSYLGLTTQGGRFIGKGASVWELTNNAAGDNHLKFAQLASGTNGSWITTATLALTAHILELIYSSQSLANIPVLNYDGVGQTYGTATQPTGTITDDAGAISIGNHPTLARGLAGSLGELYLWENNIPSSAQRTAMRADQKTYWSTP